MGTVILLSALLLCRYGRKTNTSADLSGHSLPICPRDVFRVTDRSAFRLDRRNQVSSGVTVMAVAADLHRDFLIPDSAAVYLPYGTDNAHLLRMQ